MAHCGWPPFVSAPATKSAHTLTGAGSSKLVGTFAAYRAIGCLHRRPVDFSTRERSATARKTVQHALKQAFQVFLATVIRTFLTFAKELSLRLEGGACGC